MDQSNPRDDDDDDDRGPLSRNSHGEIVDKLGQQTMKSKMLANIPNNQNEKSEHQETVDSKVTFLENARESAPKSTDTSTKNIPSNPHESSNKAARNQYNDEDENDERGAKEQTTDEAETKNQISSSRSTIGRVIMIDGIKFVAVTCLRPPKGNCRTCSNFGCLLYFSARSCYILEAAEKFCSVQCARKFINDKRYHVTPSRQPSGDVGSNVSIPDKQHVPTDQIHVGRKDSGSLSKDNDSGARGRKALKSVMKSKPASRSVGTLESIYIDSLVLKKEDRQRNHKKSVNVCTLTEQVVPRGQTPPLNSRRLGGSNLKGASNSDTSLSVKASKSTNISESSDSQCYHKEVKRDSKRRGNKKKDIQIALSNAGQKPSTSPVAKQGKEEEQSLKGQIKTRLSFPPISSAVWKRGKLESVITNTGRHKGNEDRQEGQCGRSPASRGTHRHVQKHSGTTNHSNEKEKATSRRRRTDPSRIVTRDSPSRIWPNKRLWKKYGTKFRSRSCEFHQPSIRVPRECGTPDSSCEGLVVARKKDTVKANKDSDKSLNQFHERRRSLFKTMFPFQESLGPSGVQGPGKLNFPGEETPSETSVIEESGDVYAPAPDSPNSVLGVSKAVGKEKTKRHIDCKKLHIKSDKRNADKSNSNWTNLFQFMIEASDREEAERKQKFCDCNEQENTSTYRSILKDSIPCLTQTTRTVAYPVSRRSEEVGQHDNQISEEQIKKKKKKKKKKRKRKKEKRLRENDDHRGVSVNPEVNDKKQPDTPRHGRRKKRKDKKYQSRRESKSPNFPPGSQDDPEAWPKWRGDGRKKMDMMTSVDHLLWTMKNRFEPKIGQSPNASANFPLHLIESSYM